MLTYSKCFSFAFVRFVFEFGMGAFNMNRKRGRNAIRKRVSIYFLSPFFSSEFNKVEI